MRMLSLYSIKGGVGKTASAVNLAAEAANHGLRVLLWDLDPQAATTYYLKIKPRIRGGVNKLVKGKSSFDKVIRSTAMPNLDVLPASLESRSLDQLLEKRGTSHLRQMLHEVRNDYDLIVLDCPPTLSHLSENMFTSADALLVPVVPTTLSLRTLDQLQSFLDDEGLACPVWPFVTLADRRRTLHRDIMDTLGAQWPLRMSTVIPAASAVERMGVERAPLCSFAPHSPANKAYQALWKELHQRLGIA